ncbi:MAG: hypothetical protein AAGI52_13655 [Bacteroidota bacterium]
MRVLMLLLVGAFASGCQETVAAWNDCKSSSMGYMTVSQDTVEVGGRQYFLIDHTYGIGGSYSKVLISDESAYAADELADVSSSDTLVVTQGIVWRLRDDTLQIMRVGLGPSSFGGLPIDYVEPPDRHTPEWFRGTDPDGWQWVDDCR